LLSAIRFYIRAGGRERRGYGDRAATRGRSNDTGYRVFHKDSMKIARDFITGEMSVNKNEYTGWRVRESAGGKKLEKKRERERERGRNGVRSLSVPPPFALPPESFRRWSLTMARRFESAISRRTRKLRRLDHCGVPGKSGSSNPATTDTRLSFPLASVTQRRSTPRSLARLDV